MDDVEKLAAWLKESKPVEWAEILRHEKAAEILIEFCFDGMLGKDQHRVYEVKRAPAWAYSSSVSGGQEHFTTEAAGPNGEPLERRREWLVTESGGYIGSFETLEDLAVMILHQLRGRNIMAVSYENKACL